MRQQYSSYQECVDFFNAAQKSHPDLFRVETIGETWEKRDMFVVTISKGMHEADLKPALFTTGTIHAREWIGIELSIAFAKYVLDHIDYDPHLNQLLTRATFYMVPIANPDGFEYSRNHFSFWRKNRRQNADGSFGVDLNRNFSVGYEASKNTASNVYSGPSPFSEPETLALKNFVESHPNITIALDYHSQGNVFFPAHNFIHEDAIDATDLNTLAANMAEEIRKVSEREYGVHMGKPPVSLISGSGREFYYSKGALALVVEVGSRNISDYQENMTEHINENIPALIYALSEAPHYQEDGLPRVEEFISTAVSDKDVELSWTYPDDESIYFEIYRSEKRKGYTQSSNRIGMTKSRTYTDRHLNPAMDYYYFIRAVNKERYIKSPFAPVVGVHTQPAYNMFSSTLFPLRDEIGYVGEKTRKNKEHFGNNSLFVGISETKGECFGVSSFSLESVPENAVIKSARISFYPMNRVSVQIEKFGEWRVGLMDERTCDTIYSYDDIRSAKILGYIGKPTRANQLSQGIWRTYEFAKQERTLLQDCLKRRKAVFRMEGPTMLPLDRSSQMMQWDIGYGNFSGGLTFRPKLEISYTIEEAHLELHSQREYTIAKKGVKEGELQAGYDRDGSRVYACMEFDLTQMPDIETTVISDAYVDMTVQKIDALKHLRFHLELIKMDHESEKSYEKVKAREVVERIGYDVSVEDLKAERSQRFVFDRLAVAEMVRSVKASEKLMFVIYASSEKTYSKLQSVSWMDVKRQIRPKLIIDYIKKRRHGVAPVNNLRTSIDNDRIRLDWANPDDEAFHGVIVVKNSFHMPSSPLDGVKLYGGRDNYTFDSFGDKKAKKYYAVFTYDNVPNYSEAAWIGFNIES